MGITEEQPRSIEAVMPENSFRRFVRENSDIFDNLAQTTRALKIEDQGRRNDPIIDDLVEQAISIAGKSGFRFKKPGELRVMVCAFMFDRREYTDGQLHQGTNVYNR